MRITARTVSAALADYEKWLMAGVGAAAGFAFGNFSTLAKAFTHSQLVWLGCLLGVVLMAATFALLFAAQVAASTQAVDEVENAVKEILGRPGSPDDADGFVRAWQAEMERGLWWPAIWGFRYGVRRALEGDFVAGSRLAAKLSQLQAFLFIFQVGALLSMGAIAFHALA
jgi:hypothetical protein